MDFTVVLRTFGAALLLTVPLLQPAGADAAGTVDPPVDVYAEASALGVVVGWTPVPSDGPVATEEFVVSRSTDQGATWTDVGPALGREGIDTGFPVAEGVPASGSAQFRVRVVRDGVASAPSEAVTATRPASSLLIDGIAGYNPGAIVRRGSLNPAGAHAAYLLPEGTAWAVSPDGQEVLMQDSGGSQAQPYRLLRLAARGATTGPGTVIRTSAQALSDLEWSPDGQTLLWREYDATTSSTLLRWGPIAGATQTTSPELDFREPHWLPDSSTLVGVRFGFVAFLDTRSGHVQETALAANSVAVSPDGRQLLVTKDGPSTFSLYPLDPNTRRLGTPVVSTVATSFARQTGFGPDGRSVVFRGDFAMQTAPVTSDGHLGQLAGVAQDDQRVKHATWHAYRPNLSRVRSSSGAVTSFAITPGLLPAGTTYGCALDGAQAAPCNGSWAVPPGLEAGRHTLTVRATSPSGEVTIATRTWASQTGLFTPVTAKRVLDTRSGLGAPRVPIGPGKTITLTIPGLPSDTTAVAVNLTGTAPTANTNLAAYPADRAKPLASNLNLDAGQTLANLVTVGVAPGGKVKVTNARGSVHAVADLVGYYRSSTGSRFVSMTPGRILDTRTGKGAPKGPLSSGGEVTLSAPAVPSGATALALTVTSTGSSGNGYFTVYPNSTPKPAASTLNYAPNRAVANMAMVALDGPGLANLANTGATTHAVGDATGYFTLGGGAEYTSLTPRRVVDTRIGAGVPRAKLGAGQTVTFTLENVPGGASAAILNVTSVLPAAAGYLSAYPANASRPSSSTVNFVAGQTISASTAVAIDTEGRVTIANGSSSPVDVVVDLSGYYAH